MFDIEFIVNQILLPLPWIILGLAFHEFCHAWMSDHLGDLTPQREGRLTLNPIKHIDPIGLIAIIIFRFGWAKPVHIDPRYYKNPLRDTVCVSLAGPVGNFILALLFTLIIRIMAFINISSDLINYVGIGIFYFLALGFFNLIPIPPLDGSKILRYFLRGRSGYQFDRLEPYGMILLLIILFIPGCLLILFDTTQLITNLLSGRTIFM
jgi:Zn-dependent protease